MRGTRKVACGVSALLLAAALAGCTTMADRNSEAAKIAALNKAWLDLVARRDAQAIGRLYAEDGAILPADQPIAIGPKEVAGVWAGFLKLPSFTLNFRTTKLDIAKSGDLASDLGTYSLAFDDGKRRVRDVGKYVVVWKKVDGKWKVAADIFNSDRAH